ncbi:hypothetical protein [Bdellovibrio bacteriovorus]|uniref:Uncharacterized protein n=1 Tax=Bdellovibrio bacteriovorus str. Tiberius TaxID=1069642 RepID=K7Z1E8_BDEBC|nr:hypothetical protein [Bdellovibrio bacteriovorus]AFY02865.1 hypothetical protein Bdt_3190 [Bdellovibrio bacteriovorus str. Tiberius]
MMFLLAILFGFTTPSHAADMSVVDVRRNITLSETDTIYKDFYINAGPGSGLKKNLVVTAVRKINIRDASGANAVGEILVPVGQLKIIAIYDRVAVAREFTLLSRDELPMLEQIGIMTGDRIDLGGSFIDNSKPKAKKKVAEAEMPPATEVVVTAVTTVTTPALTAQNPVVSANPTQVVPAVNTAPAALALTPPQTAERLDNSVVSDNTTRNE